MDILKCIVLLVAAVFAATNNSYAQSYNITPNDTIQMVGAMEDLETLSIQQLNISVNTINIKWKKVSESVPSNWEASNCDNRICNTTLVDSGMMNPVIPNDYGLLLLHITPHVNFGTAVVRYAVWDIAYPSLKDTLTYILTVSNASGIHEIKSEIDYTFFPNPVKDNIRIVSSNEADFTFSINDLSGKKICSGITSEKSILVSMEDIPNGIYLISITDRNGIIKTKKIIVQH